MIITPERNRSNFRLALLMAAAIGAAVLLIAYLAGGGGPAGLAIWGVPAVLAAAGIFVLVRRETVRRLRVQAEPFPEEYRKVLESRVLYYRGLDDVEKERFHRMALTILDEVRITGIRTDVDTTTRVLVAASAVIPVFGFPEWEYERLGEVLIYPTSFDRDYQTDRKDDRSPDILGMVGTGHLTGVMILSKDDLLHGFDDDRDRRNVGIHEFAHLVDRADGAIDGVPPGLRRSIAPWRREIRETLAKSHLAADIDPYAFTNEAEFFAVLTEYFFESPDLLQRKHPGIYSSLEALFQQDTRSRLAKARRVLGGWRKQRVGRNDPCPCGSGKKYKKCCLQ